MSTLVLNHSINLCGRVSGIVVEVAKALGGSFKLSYASAKNCKGDDSTAHGNINRDTQTNQKA